MQQGMLVDRQLPRDLRAQELAGDLDFHSTQAAQPVERRVEVIDKLLIRFGQTVIPISISSATPHQ
jgi:hypothetical protein